MSDGIILVDKPVGITSHDLVNLLRRRLGTKKIGHAGTLDPFASGLVISGVNKGTRILEYFLEMDKTYMTELVLGRITDTFDITGRTVEERKVPGFSFDEVFNALKSFEGEYLQVPPAYSAKKYNGERLYKLAREGKIINLPPKPVKIYSIDDIGISYEKVTFTAKVSKGTYIRSLVMDIGYKLGCGATATKLRRISQGNFSVDSAHQIDDVSDFSIISLEDSIDFLPGLLLNDSESSNVLLGKQIYASGVAGVMGKFAKNDLIRIIGSDERLLAVARSERTSSFIKTLLAKNSLERVAKLEKVLGA
ncbi:MULTISPECIES: tRNA pseudouridine(55) synthase TruB [Mesotoga]|uniref:tRNA pseudouridine(55) synthase TruB n=1 Tax=Mesotoga TaxID=1184396 RepID=UPI0002CA0276|nr:MULTISPECIES: tRNA pseudouridine(55) synthase TruB [Mesotoga]MCP5456791.1 tRNA pseudouridine(55) synthase TruB [Thermotogota bacterium]RLL92646.1 tRNA pseudouridine synthase B [Mesotoga sp. HF07.pep.5.2.highcov]CCU86116.1 tRNA pseudouridine synthase B [Mesotoga infera]RLL86761.1 tRNA pseudouridine synthase B [Mesotoga sp. H07pep.5.4]HNS76414.1 tRNA pseudouridine(55) synthase TruB [Mesotoga prima]